MNKIYKVIWSHVKQCYVVTSELVKAHGRTSTRGRTLRLAVAALTAFILTAGVTSVGLADNNDNIITNTDTKISDINANITGKGNKVTDSSNAEIVGDGNDVTNVMKGRTDTVRSDDARIVGSNNTISGSRNQQVIGDHNTIIGRDKGTVTDYSHPGGRDWSVSDITIGRENVIQSADTYRNEWDSLTVIGNHNLAEFGAESAGGPSSGIVIGDNQNIDSIGDSIVIGSLSPKEQAEKGNTYGHKYGVVGGSIIIGYHTSNSAGESVVIGNRSQSNGQYQTITGPRSIIEGNQKGSMTGDLASVYGAFNKIKNGAGENEVDGIGNSITGAYNVTSDAQGTMIMGLNNTVTHAKAPDVMFNVDDELASSLGRNMSDIWLNVENFGNQYYNDGLNKDDKGNNLHLSYDDAREALSNYMTNSGGVVSVLGNNNSSDYTIRSQILGTNNHLTGNDTSFSSNNTISGFSNTGENLKSTSIIGTKNTLRNSEDNVVIGDYHNMDGWKHNVILGSMKSEEKTVTKSYDLPIKPASDDPDMPKSLDPIKYTVTEQVPVKDHKNDIENAVMVGYNTDATVDGGVALGSDSIASTKAGKTGYDAKGKTHAASDKDYAAWVSTDAAVSVGRAEEKDEKTGKVTSNAITRQITNLAAGTQDTDAVNVAQLKASEANINTTINNVDKKVAVIFDDKSSLMSTDATIDHQILEDSGKFPEGEGQSIALGKGANAFMQGGRKAKAMLFGMKKAAGAIAIGEGAQALSQSIDIGNRTYKGEIGDVKISDYWNWGTGSGVASVLLGTNSYTGGTLSTLIGDYSIMSTGYPNGYGGNSGSYLQNAGAVSVGALNSIESATSRSGYSGVANSIVGLANKTNNANGALIYGAGNEITNSTLYISAPTSGDSAKSAAESLRTSIKNNPGGAVLAIGGGNKADWTQRTQIIGVANTVQGSQDKPSIYNMVDGYNTTLNNSSHVYTIGYRNDFNNENNSVVIGDYHQMTNGKNNVVIGSYDGSYQPAGWNKPESTTYLTNDKLEDAVMIGHNADVQKNGGVALGAGSVASVDKDVVGYDPSGINHSEDTTGVWKSKAAAVSVGQIVKNEQGQPDAEKTITRQITGVAAGSEDTDAVNVAQLKAISSAINTDITASKTHFYSVNSTDEKAKNYDNKGATAANALAAGVGAQALKDSAVAIGDAAHAESSNSVVIGTGAWTRSSNGDKPTANGGDVAIGQKAYIDSYVNQGGSIALGQNARVENTNGSTERKYAFGQTEFEGDNIPLNPGNEAGGVAIGRNSFARTGSLMVGSHMYKGAIADMDEVDGTDSQNLRENFNNINMTTLGTNSFNNGTFATVTGAYSATTAKKKIQNFAATVDGSLNSIESYKDAADNSGVASSIVGTANRIANSNNTTILGAGNEVTNSLADITAPTDGGASAKALQDTLKGKLQQDAKGAVVVSGIGNKVDSSHGVAVLGSRNLVNATDNIQLFGDNREVKGANGSVIIGSADIKTTTSVKDATILGHNANVEKEGGVALGSGSIASREAQVAGYDPSTKEASKDTSATWKATNAAVSVGKEDGSMTRQITGVAAGSKATDAVNVAQLQKALAGAKDGNDTLKSSTDALKLVDNKLSMNIQDTAGNTVSGSVDLSKLAQAVDTNTTYTLTGQENKDNTTTITLEGNNGKKNSVTVATKDTRNTVKAGENVTLDTKDNADGSHEYTVNVKADGKIEAGSTKIVSGDTVYNETRVAKDGTFVKQSNTAGENLTALDNQVTANTESIYHMNNRVSDLDNRVNKVGAGAAALAALHPLDFNPDDKWNFAVGYGNYRNANSVAVGAFYQPNENTMFNVATNFGNGENMINAGVSFKIGKGNSYAGISKAQLVAENQQLKENDALQDQKIQKQDQEIQELKKALEELKSRIK